MGLALENTGQRDGRSAHIAVFGSSLVELPQVYRAAADRYDLIDKKKQTTMIMQDFEMYV